MLSQSPSIRQVGDEIQRLKNWRWLEVGPKGAREHWNQLAPSINVAESPIDREPEVLVAVEHRQRVRLNCSVRVGHDQICCPCCS